MPEPTPVLNKPSLYARARTVTGWTIFFMVILRVFIGWHFLYEGIVKVESGTFSSTPYLMASTGPLKNFFRGMVYDPDGLQRMEQETLHAAIDKRYELIRHHYELDEQQAKVLAAFRDRKKHGKMEGDQIDPVSVDQILKDPDFLNQLQAYKSLLAQIEQAQKHQDPSFKQERLLNDEAKATKARNALLARVEEPLNEFKPERMGHVNFRLTEEQLAAGPLPSAYTLGFPGKQLTALGLELPEKTLTFWLDLMMMFGLIVVGACLMLGLFTRLAALGGVALLAMFYLSMPPWPGVPEPAGMTEGHYLFVNKNLIELVALLMIATTRVGRWFGIDAFFGAISERRKQRRAAAAMAAQSPRDRVYLPETRSPARDPQRSS
jgi:uncharacterized membrane protein YphA (DoxX/SURF4 family)